VASYRSVLEHIDPDGPAAAKERAALASARKAVEAAGGFGASTGPSALAIVRACLI
jgi:hypothetical protein